ncbi:hypothetical protein BJ508DRAFT_309234 [Ascobolus immersus RN42]|uniref:Uncharacterized protein n=1 Tax=Ascobolus immersus RN42 TaxID=1160509 RepID=A0A3N4HZC1_ASCIM|nr:hypothetical protein BJ508DRAFT_309234 [Ascobolus immersus RN42]
MQVERPTLAQTASQPLPGTGGQHYQQSKRPIATPRSQKALVAPTSPSLLPTFQHRPSQHPAPPPSSQQPVQLTQTPTFQRQPLQPPPSPQSSRQPARPLQSFAFPRGPAHPQPQPRPPTTQQPIKPPQANLDGGIKHFKVFERSLQERTIRSYNESLRPDLRPFENSKLRDGLSLEEQTRRHLQNMARGGPRALQIDPDGEKQRTKEIEKYRAQHRLAIEERNNKHDAYFRAHGTSDGCDCGCEDKRVRTREGMMGFFMRMPKTAASVEVLDLTGEECADVMRMLFYQTLTCLSEAVLRLIGFGFGSLTYAQAHRPEMQSVKNWLRTPAQLKRQRNSILISLHNGLSLNSRLIQGQRLRRRYSASMPSETPIRNKTTRLQLLFVRVRIVIDKNERVMGTYTNLTEATSSRSRVEPIYEACKLGYKKRDSM